MRLRYRHCRRVLAGGAAILLCMASTPAARANGMEGMYSTDALAEMQYRVGKFVPGVFHEIITPVLTEDERRRVAGVRFDFPLQAPGRDPLGFWREGRIVHFSAASMRFWRDALLSYVWLGRHGYQLSSLNKYMLMVRCWRGGAPPAAPQPALRIPQDISADKPTGDYAAVLTRHAFQFIMLHELGHVLHDPPGAVTGIPQEIAADQFALDVLGRLRQVPTGAATLFQLLAFHEADVCSDAGRAVTTHPFNRDRLRAVARDIGEDAAKYAQDQSAETLAEFRTLQQQIDSLANQLEDPHMQALLRQLAMQTQLGDLAPEPRP